MGGGLDFLSLQRSFGDLRAERNGALQVPGGIHQREECERVSGKGGADPGFNCCQY